MNKTVAFRMLCIAAIATLAMWPTEAPATYLFKAVVDNCQNRSLKPEDRIRACTELLDSGTFTHKFKAAFLVDRALAYLDEDDKADALVDLRQAVEYDPDYVAARKMRDELDPRHADPVPAAK